MDSEKYSISKHKDIVNRTYNGQIKIDEYKKAFNSALNSEKELKEEALLLKKDEILALLGGYQGQRYKSEKKERAVDALVSDIITFFAIGGYSWSHGESEYASVIEKVNGMTQETLDKFAEEVRQAREERQKEKERIMNAIEDPKTIEDFKLFFKYKGKDKMTPEQSKIYDELIGVKTIENREAQIEQKAVINKVQLGKNVNLDIHETKHTQTGEDLFVVKLSERVDRDTYNELNKKAKQLGGWYSSYTKGGAIAGFQFKTKDSAEKFISLKNENVSNIEKVEEKLEEKKEKRASKLRENAESIIERVDKELNKDRLTNTARRASQASSTEGRLNKEKSIAKTMLNLANAIENGETKFLDLLRTKAQVEYLTQILDNANYVYLQDKYKSYSEYERHKYDPIEEEAVSHIHPQYLYFPRLYSEHWKRAVNTYGERAGLKLISNKINHLIGNSEYFQVKDKVQMEYFIEFAEKIPETWETTRIKEAIKDHKRLKSLGIESNEMLRAVLREFLIYKGDVAKVDKVKELERKLAGRKGIGFDYFPTPKSVAMQMVEMADIGEGMSILEPSAGNGNIADVIKETTGIYPDVIEISSELREILKEKGYDVVENDFLEFNEKKYDRIIMNPPFSNRMDGTHIIHAFNLLNPNGKIIAIAGEGIFFGNDKKAIEFREFLEENNAIVDKLPENTFKDTSLYSTTGANARLIVLNKKQEQNETNTETMKLIREPQSTPEITELVEVESVEPEAIIEEPNSKLDTMLETIVEQVKKDEAIFEKQMRIRDIAFAKYKAKWNVDISNTPLSLFKGERKNDIDRYFLEARAEVDNIPIEQLIEDERIEMSQEAEKLMNTFNELEKIEPKNKATKGQMQDIVGEFFEEIVSNDISFINQFIGMLVRVPNYDIMAFIEDNDIWENFTSKLNVNLWTLIPNELTKANPVKKVVWRPDINDSGLRQIIKDFPLKDGMRPLLNTARFDEKGIVATDAHDMLFIKANHEFRGNYCLTTFCEKNLGKEVEGIYPAYQTVIPTRFNSEVNVNAYTILSYINGAKSIKWYATYGEGLIYQIDNVLFAFRNELMQECVKAMLMLGHTELTMLVSEPSRAMVICPKGKNTPIDLNHDFALIMPTMLDQGNDYKGRLLLDLNEQCVLTIGITDTSCINPVVIKELETKAELQEIKQIAKEAKLKADLLEAENQRLKDEKAEKERLEREEVEAQELEATRIENERLAQIEPIIDETPKLSKVEIIEKKLKAFETLVKITKDATKKVTIEQKIKGFTVLLKTFKK